MSIDDLRTESEIQRDIIVALRERGALVFRMNAGRGGRQRREFNPPGTPDLECVSPDGRVVWIEVKTPNGVVSPDQLAMHEDLERRNQEVLIARGVEDIEELVDV